MNFTTEQQLWEHYSDDTITHNNINDLINDWLNVLQFTDNDGNLLTEQELKNYLKTNYPNITDWSF
tara:strand:- start:1102 stop:1299 length:198 start_codon:yes stop_codon:yes gene_type:complete